MLGVIFGKKLKNMQKLLLLTIFLLSLSACTKPQSSSVPRDKSATTIKIVDRKLELHQPTKRPLQPLNGILPHWLQMPDKSLPKPAIYTNLNTVLKNK